MLTWVCATGPISAHGPSAQGAGLLGTERGAARVLIPAIPPGARSACWLRAKLLSTHRSPFSSHHFWESPVPLTRPALGTAPVTSRHRSRGSQSRAFSASPAVMDGSGTQLRSVRPKGESPGPSGKDLPCGKDLEGGFLVPFLPLNPRWGCALRT